MFRKFGFGDLWMKWMDVLVFSSNMLILVNGSTTKEFLVEKGLRQRDLLSLFFFINVAEALPILDKRSMELRDFVGFYINDYCGIDILQFSDDTLLVGNASWKHIWAVKSVLRVFEIVSGLDINFHKSKLIGINISYLLLEATACRTEDKSFSFLGIPTGSNSRRIPFWFPY
ncbi:uncharacterized protein LOC131623895 [Vicia villosa]|uniref:uncharacterized protein LOC131623895 n=1 Tax=Vicia villosa TaxID=3911 RepID=UPI00273BC7DB|nr:uncharacterized protein LOC131623895 [Vicia villosa]